MAVATTKKRRRDLINPALGQRLRRLRRKHELTLAEVAATAGVLDETYLSKAERGTFGIRPEEAKAVRRAIRELVAKGG